jgi:enoyl-CoA hydratase
MSEDHVIMLEVSEGVATLTLNRPEARNALSRQLLRELSATVTECERREDVRVTVLTGADPAFCAGLDLSELAVSGTLRRQPVVAGEVVDGPASSVPSGPFPSRRKPLIGAINGPAVTGGLELALACDFLVASDRARFADTHARVGVQPAWGLTVLLPQAIGVRRAREMSATGNFVDARTALAWGLVNHVVAHERLLDTVRSIALDIAGSDPGGVERILATYAEGSLLSAGEAWTLETTVAATWLREGHGQPDDVAQRKQVIIERGHLQVGRGGVETGGNPKW